MKVEVGDDIAQILGMGVWCKICETKLDQKVWDGWTKEGKAGFVVTCPCCGANYRVTEVTIDIDFALEEADDQTKEMWRQERIARNDWRIE